MYIPRWAEPRVSHHVMSVSVKNLCFLFTWRHFLSRGSRRRVCLVLSIWCLKQPGETLRSVSLISNGLDVELFFLGGGMLLSKVAQSCRTSQTFSSGGVKARTVSRIWWSHWAPQAFSSFSCWSGAAKHPIITVCFLLNTNKFHKLCL